MITTWDGTNYTMQFNTGLEVMLNAFEAQEFELWVNATIQKAIMVKESESK